MEKETKLVQLMPINDVISLGKKEGLKYFKQMNKEFSIQELCKGWKVSSATFYNMYAPQIGYKPKSNKKIRGSKKLISKEQEVLCEMVLNSNKIDLPLQFKKQDTEKVLQSIESDKDSKYNINTISKKNKLYDKVNKSILLDTTEIDVNKNARLEQIFRMNNCTDLNKIQDIVFKANSMADEGAIYDIELKMIQK